MKTRIMLYIRKDSPGISDPSVVQGAEPCISKPELIEEKCRYYPTDR